MSGGFVASAVAAGALLAVLGHHGGTAVAAPGKAAAAAIAYARAQLGKPYEWGGTGPGRVRLLRAGHAGVRLGRGQYRPDLAGAVGDRAACQRPGAGDLVFFAGADGTASAPGHVGLVVDPSRDLMIDAYAPGVPIHEETYGQPGSAPGLQDPVGFTDPSGGS